MKKKNKKRYSEKMRKEYDFSKGVRGKYAKLYLQGNNLVFLSKDLAKIFPDSNSVNQALRTLVEIAKRAA